MPRIPEATIDKIKTEISLLRLIEAQGYNPKKQGKDYVMTCPWHDDKTPSLIISPTNNLWSCKGACNIGGTVIDWTMKTQGVSFRHACEILLNGQASVTEAKPNIKTNTTQPLAAELDASASTDLRWVIDYYHETLQGNTDAESYLEQRGLNNAELINTFKLGYANRTLGYRLPAKNRVAGKEIRQRLQDMGIMRDTGHEHFSGSIVVPIWDDKGNVSEVYGRKVGASLRKGTPLHLYLPGPHKGIWNLDGLKHSTEVILCEALFDAMTFWLHGYRNVTTSYGTSGFTPDHLAVFKSLKIERVLIAYDRDAAGDKSADKLAQQLMQQGFECFRIVLPQGMDINEYAQTMQPPAEALGMIIRKAHWMGQGQATTEVAPLREVAPQQKVESQQEVEAIAAKQEKLFSLAAKDVEPSEPVKPVPTLPASPMPKALACDIPCEINQREISLTLADRTYRVRGLSNNSSYEQLKINLMVSNETGFHTDSLELYNAKQRTTFSHQAATELRLKEQIIKQDLGQILLKLEQLQQQQIENSNPEPIEIPLTQAEELAALELLKLPNLLQQILADFDTAGVVGEESNKLIGYLACTSRKLDRPLAVVIQSSSAAGKSSLMDAIVQFMPEIDCVQYSAMTGQSLFYMGETQLKHKILAIAEEEGASNASYALKLLQSEGEVTIASTGKDVNTGELITQEYHVEGPIMLFMTTTAIDIDEELMNRCLILSVNEEREQTQRIHQAQRQRRTIQGLQNKIAQNYCIQLHRNAQRLLKPLAVINPYADQLTFLADKTRTRRDHEKYLTLIDTIALLHQHQRQIKTHHYFGEAIEYIEVTIKDIEQANKLAHEILGRTLDELPPQTRKLLKQICQMVYTACKKLNIAVVDYRFSRKMIREYSQWGNTQLKIHCKRLEEMEYLLVHRGGRGQSIEYELLYDGDNEVNHKHLMGLIDSNKLYDSNKSGSNRPQVRPESAPSQTDNVPSEASSSKDYAGINGSNLGSTVLGLKKPLVIPVDCIIEH